MKWEISHERAQAWQIRLISQSQLHLEVQLLIVYLQSPVDHGGPQRHPSTVIQYVRQGCVGLHDALIQKCIEMHLGGYMYSHGE